MLTSEQFKETTSLQYYGIKLLKNGITKTHLHLAPSRVGLCHRNVLTNQQWEVNCSFCVFEATVTPWSLPGSLAYGWCERVISGKRPSLCISPALNQPADAKIRPNCASLPIRKRSLSWSLTTDDDASVAAASLLLPCASVGELIGSTRASQDMGRLWIMAKQHIVDILQLTAGLQSMFSVPLFINNIW